MKIYKNEKEYMKSEIKCTEECELYEVYWGDTEDESILIICNASCEDFKRELAYFKKFREDSGIEIWKEFEDFLIDRGYRAQRYFTEQPTYISYHGCNID